MLGVDAAMGRTLTDLDDLTSDPQPVAVISHGFWQRRFGAAPGVLGGKIMLNDFPFTIVGVAPMDSAVLKAGWQSISMSGGPLG